ncbi:MAG TPA: nucleotide disphospho-sugar-binding domain-containing protein [Jatrophihabitans sp.]|nr:nucleotide disphospho-sugar-binding domain-containing protein [Jatrophihabitans sp.]
MSATVLFMPESAYGPTNQCIGVGDILRRRGHRVVFAAEASWSGRLAALGFEEDLVDLAPPSETEAAAGQFWTDFVRETAPEFRKPTVEQLTGFIRPTWQALIDGAKYCEPQLREIIARVRPDVIVEDNVVAFPALLTAEAPFVRIVSCNPLEIPDAALPPVFSGLPAGERSQWAAFRAEYERTHRTLWAEFDEWVVAQGAPHLPELEFVHTSPTANLFVYPEELDYPRSTALDGTWHRMPSSVRETEAQFELPPGDAAWVYVSLGSLGGADVDLMKRLVEALARSEHRFVVSKGPRAGEYELADNMVGADVLPQTKVLPQVDLVLTHGGNNTVTEAMHFGKPMIVLPLFWDQHDNAQRVHETGYGIRLDTYAFTDTEMLAAVDRLLTDEDVRRRAAAAGQRIRQADGLRRGADVIEAVATG